MFLMFVLSFFFVGLYIVLDQIPDFLYKDTDFAAAVNISEILKKSKSEEMFQFIDVYAGGGYSFKCTYFCCI